MFKCLRHLYTTHEFVSAKADCPEFHTGKAKRTYDSGRSAAHKKRKIISNMIVAGRILRVILIFLFVILDDNEICFAHDTSSYGTFEDFSLSRPEDCLRTCREDEPPRYCYYHFTLEYYVAMNGACTLCRPNNTNQLTNTESCQCVEVDGVERTVFSINRMIPGPSIQVCENDMVIVDVANHMDGAEVSLHWHGLFQNNYQYYDGVPFLTQCPIHAQSTFRYQFRAKNAGTHFWHSHSSVHKIDGQYGSLIVRQPSSLDPQKQYYDKDLPTHVIVLSDWMHQLALERVPGLLHRLPGQVAQNILINGKGTWLWSENGTETTSSIEIFNVVPGKRYRFRMINSFSTVCLSQLYIEDHKLTIIAQDGENVEPVDVDSIISGSGERVDFVLDATQSAKRSYWIQVKGLGECAERKVQQFAVLKYSKSSSTLPPTARPQYSGGLPDGIVYNPLDALCDEGKTQICPHQFKSIEDDDPDLLIVEPDYQFMIPFKFHVYSDDLKELFKPGSYKRFMTAIDQSLLMATINNIIYEEPSHPLISQSNKKYRSCTTPSFNILEDTKRTPECVHTLHVDQDSVVEIVFVDVDPQPLLSHPFHLHGHAFRLFDIGRFPELRNITRADMAPILKKHKKRLMNGSYSQVPAKDTVIVPQGGWVIMRFKANNPGWWLFHCHFIWHTAFGMDFVIHVGEQEDLPPVPSGFPRCGDFTPAIYPME